jgi:hypothetical protein
LCENVYFIRDLCCVRFEVLMAVTLKHTVFWYVKSYSLLVVFWYFWGECAVSIFMVEEWDYSSTLKMEAVCSPRMFVNVTTVHTVTSQKAVFFRDLCCLQRTWRVVL